MKKYLTGLAFGFVTITFITFIFGIGDDAYVAYYKESIWYKDIFNSIEYYILNVLPYWWLIMLIGAFVISGVFYCLRIVVNQTRE